jgi:hypothetical protein
MIFWNEHKSLERTEFNKDIFLKFNPVFIRKTYQIKLEKDWIRTEFRDGSTEPNLRSNPYMKYFYPSWVTRGSLDFD